MNQPRDSPAARDWPETTFEMLNDDCLYHILLYLRIEDQMNFSLVCRRFDEVTRMLFRSYKSVDFKDLKGLTAVQMYDFLKEIGKQAIRLICDSDSHRTYIECLTYFFPNIEYLKLYAIDLTIIAYEILTKIATNLTTLTLFDCNIDDYACFTLKNCTKLRYLDLSHNYEITGKYLDSLPNLQALSLCWCLNVESAYFIAICKAVKLIELNIHRCAYIKRKEYDILLQTQTDLEVFCLTNSYQVRDLSDIAKLPKLRHLEIVLYKKKKTLPFLSELVKYKSQDLKVLTFFARDLNDSLMEHILNFSGLEELRTRVNDQFLAKLPIRMPNLKVLRCEYNSELSIDAVISFIVNAKNLDTICLSYYGDYDYPFDLPFILKLFGALQWTNRPKPIHVILRNECEEHYEFELKSIRHLLKLPHDLVAKKELLT